MYSPERETTKINKISQLEKLNDTNKETAEIEKPFKFETFQANLEIYFPLQDILEKHQEAFSYSNQIKKTQEREVLIKENTLYKLILLVNTLNLSHYTAYALATTRLNQILKKLNASNPNLLDLNSSIDEKILKMVLDLDLNENKNILAWLIPLKTLIRNLGEPTQTKV